MAVFNVRKIAILILTFAGVFFIFVAISGCGDKYSYNPALSDLGGVYACKEGAPDFSLEISGRLPEGNPGILAQEECDECMGQHVGLDLPVMVTAKNMGLSNRLLRWGLLRKKDNQPPAADPGTPELLKKYGAVYIGDTTKKVVYFTFDEGYENGYTPDILDTLRENGVRAVFFITGAYLKGQQSLIRRMVEEGHIVGNHTIHHPSLPELDDSQLEEEVLGLDRAFHEKFGQHMVFLRPPKGEYSERTLALTKDLGYCTLFWSFAYDDWYRDKIRGAEYAKDIVMRNLHNGAVLLLHAVSKDNAEALDSIIKGLLEKGYVIGDPMGLLPAEGAEDCIYGP